jgi:electron transport complex protein RnfD
MAGYVVLLLSFPIQMTQWATPVSLLPEGTEPPNVLESLSLIFSASSGALDAITSATPLDLLKQNSSLMLEQFYSETPVFSEALFTTHGFEWVSLGFLLGGLYLLFRKVFTWHAPIGMLVTLAVLPLIFFDGGSSASKGSSWFHLMSGATMLGAFFIITDPVSGATSNLGRLFFGIGVGILVFIIRSWGNYPEAVAFAVMLMNFAAPAIDYYTQPRTYGHTERNKVKIGEDDK